MNTMEHGNIQLRLPVSGYDEFSVRITGYESPENNKNWYSQWTKTDLILRCASDKDNLEYSVSYHMREGKALLSCEIDVLAEKLRDLLDDNILKEETVSFTEPDFNIVLRPKTDLRRDPNYIFVAPGAAIEDVSVLLEINLSGNSSSNRLIVGLNRRETEILLCYIRLISGRTAIDSDDVKEYTEKGYFSGSDDNVLTVNVEESPKLLTTEPDTI